MVPLKQVHHTIYRVIPGCDPGSSLLKMS